MYFTVAFWLFIYDEPGAWLKFSHFWNTLVMIEVKIIIIIVRVVILFQTSFIANHL